ncbi:MAG TPA: diaminopimelate epimerase [Candidatus Didemnitutus sp.]|nr:diaminopimelate epimerase [Candidatus Didemnitutus sp.]
MIYHHMSGAGNTFLVADGRAHVQPDLSPDDVLNALANNPRSDGIDIEGVLVLRSSDAHTFAADYYNPDGSHGMMCGNGSRCIVRFAVDHGVDATSTISFTLNGAPYTADVLGPDLIRIHFSAPNEIRTFTRGELQGVDQAVTYVDVNSDHVVIDGPRDESRPIVHALRYHAAFPRGVNVNMVDLRRDGTAGISTFERGVEAITGACGTGALSAAVALWMQRRVSDSVHFMPPSGRPLMVHIEHNGTTITGLTLEGDARYDNA